LPARRLKKLLQGDAEVSRSLADLKIELSGIRRRGYCVTRGEVDPTLLGLSAPVVAPDLAIVASLSLVLEAGAVDQAQEHRLALLLIGAADMLSQELRRVAEIAHECDRSSGS
jgi:DNA-binding IclR family transcriptional regulator